MMWIKQTGNYKSCVIYMGVYAISTFEDSQFTHSPNSFCSGTAPWTVQIFICISLVCSVAEDQCWLTLTGIINIQIFSDRESI